ncbi:hypothetical protein GCM10017559_64940 [Streptosporangium longisporum]|uniref:Uncharacterized protein n=1 Tax=Streptosporangium longisporum TaxID=46187 RepID=A0ABP6L1E1_9ACTN
MPSIGAHARSSEWPLRPGADQSLEDWGGGSLSSAARRLLPRGRGPDRLIEGLRATGVYRFGSLDCPCPWRGPARGWCDG